MHTCTVKVVLAEYIYMVIGSNTNVARSFRTKLCSSHPSARARRHSQKRQVQQNTAKEKHSSLPHFPQHRSSNIIPRFPTLLWVLLSLGMSSVMTYTQRATTYGIELSRPKTFATVMVPPSCFNLASTCSGRNVYNGSRAICATMGKCTMWYSGRQPGLSTR